MAEASAPPYRRVILKLSGESFAPASQGIAMEEVIHIARQTYQAAQLGQLLTAMLCALSGHMKVLVPVQDVLCGTKSLHFLHVVLKIDVGF